jgi:hypothetical protein
MNQQYLVKNRLMIIMGAFIFILIVLLAGAMLQKYRITQYGDTLEREIYRYKKENKALTEERDTLSAHLAPFIARADLKYPDASHEERLNLLIMEMDEITITVEGEKHNLITDRVIAEKDRLYIANALRPIAPFQLEIAYVADDPEAYRLAMQIKGIFESARWKVAGVSSLAMKPPLAHLVIEFREKPTKMMQNALLPLYDCLGYKREAFIKTDLPEDGMRIIVGSK